MDPTPQVSVPADAITGLMSPYFVGTALVVGALVEALKRFTYLWKPELKGSHHFDALVSLLPVALGTAIGWLVIKDASLPPCVLGAIAGSVSSTAYAMIKPVAKIATGGGSSDAP